MKTQSTTPRASGKEAQKMTLQLLLTVTYETNGDSERNLRDNLTSIATMAAGDGLLTTDGPAEVEQWDASVIRGNIMASHATLIAALECAHEAIYEKINRRPANLSHALHEIAAALQSAKE